METSLAKAPVTGKAAESGRVRPVDAANWDTRELSTQDDIDEFFKITADMELLSDVGGDLEVLESDRRRVAAIKNGPVVVAFGQRYTPSVKALLDLAKKKASPLQEEIVMAPTDTVTRLYDDRRSSQAPVTEVNEQARQTELRMLIARAAKDGASDIHIRILPNYTEVRFRVNGRMRKVSEISAEEGPSLVRAAIAVASDQTTRGSELTSQQGALTKKSALLPPAVDLIRLQYSPTSEQRGALVMRLKYQGGGAKSNIAELGYSRQQVSDLAIMRRRTNGLYLLSGKVSSGKSTTLERAMNAMFKEKGGEISIYTIEEPVELQIEGAIQVAVNSSDEKDRRSKFADAMRGALRSDPNVIVVGEMRDEDTADLCLHAAQTGHSLWSTVHAGTALGILDRLESLGVDRWKIAEPSITRGLLYQRLVGVTCPHCRLSYEHGVNRGLIEIDLANRVMKLTGRDRHQLYVRNPQGCDHCDVGLVGRTVVAEIIVTDAKLLDYYYQGKRSDMREYWTNPLPSTDSDPPGMGGTPVLHHAMVKVGAGLLDINEVEEEVDLLEVYERQYSKLVGRLRDEVKEMVDLVASKAAAIALAAETAPPIKETSTLPAQLMQIERQGELT